MLLFQNEKKKKNSIITYKTPRAILDRYSISIIFRVFLYLIIFFFCFIRNHQSVVRVSVSFQLICAQAYNYFTFDSFLY